MRKKILSISAIVLLGIFVFAIISIIGGTNTISADGHTFTVTEVTNEASIELKEGYVDTSQHWDYDNCYAPAFVVTVDGAEFFGYCIDVDCQYTPSATYSAERIDGDTGRLAATILTFGFHGGESIVDETDQGIGWRDTWLALRNVLDIDRAWETDGSVSLLNYAKSYLLPEGSYCYKFTYNDGQEAQAVVAVPVRGSEFGSIKVTKTDEDTGEKITGATFEVTGVSGTKVLKDGEVWEGLEPGEYTVKELTSPHGYTISNVIANVTVKAGKCEVVNCADERIKGKLVIHKTGESRNNYTFEENGIIYPYENLQGVVFELYADEDITTAYDKVMYKAGDLVTTLTTDENGDAVAEDLFFGEYYLVEKTALDGYRVEKDSFDITIDTDKNISTVEYTLDFVNYLKKGSLSIRKLNSEDGLPLSGAEFAIYDSEMNLICNITSGEDGYAKLNDLLEGTYHYQEVKAPEGFVVDSTIYSIVIEDEETSSITMENEKERGSYEKSEFYDDSTTQIVSNTPAASTVSENPNTGITTESTASSVIKKITPIFAAIFVMVGILAWRNTGDNNVDDEEE